MSDLTMLEIIDIIRMRDPQALPMTVAWDRVAKKAVVLTASAVSDETQERIRSRAQFSVMIEFQLDDPLNGVVP